MYTTIVWQNKTKITYKHYSRNINYEEADEIGNQNGYGKTIVIDYSWTFKKRLLTSIRDLKNGIQSHYPICCVLNYCIDKILNRPAALLRFQDSFEYVVCFIHHRKYGKKPIPEGFF
jgi:hypothetical protein